MKPPNCAIMCTNVVTFQQPNLTVFSVVCLQIPGFCHINCVVVKYTWSFFLYSGRNLNGNYLI